jgi:hypothetical protein
MMAMARLWKRTWVKSQGKRLRAGVYSLKIQTMAALRLLAFFLVAQCCWGSCPGWADNYVASVLVDADSIIAQEGHFYSGLFPIMTPMGGGYLSNPDGTALARAEAGASADNRSGYVFTDARVSMPLDGHGRFALSKSNLLEAITVFLPQNLLFEFNINASGASPLNLYLSLGSRVLLNCQYPQSLNFNAKKVVHWIPVLPDIYVLSVLAQVKADNNPDCPWNSGLGIAYKWYKANECFEDQWFVDGSKCGVQIKICNYDDGIRVVRYKNNSTALIGRCYYSPGGNENPLWFDENFYTIEGKYRWINYKMNPAYPRDFDKALQVDVYTYDPCHNKQGEDGENLQARSYKSYQDFKADIEQKTTPWYDGSPPSKESDLRPPELSAAVLVSAETSQSAIGLESRDAVDPGEVDIRYSPGCALYCLQNTENKWYYGLVTSEALGGLVTTGDRLSIEGPGIIGGFVEGNAATAPYGAWGVKESVPGKVVFQVGTTAAFSGIVDNFVVLAAPGAVTGQVTYRTIGDWIGSGGMLQGPFLAPKDVSWLFLLLNN